MVIKAGYTLLQSSLDVAVPLWIENLRPHGLGAICERAKELAKLEGRNGMPLIGSEAIFTQDGFKPGDSAKAFNALAESIACMSFLPGGVKTFGRHWDANRVFGMGPLHDEGQPG